MAVKKRKRVACNGASAYMLRAIKKVAEDFDESLTTTSFVGMREFKPDVLIDSCRSVSYARKYCDIHNTYLLATRHGVANKYNGPDEEFGEADYICGSDWDKRNYLDHGIKPQRDFLITGNPWNNDVFKIPKREINERCPTILFAPTWNEETSASFYFEDRLPGLISKIFPEFKLIIKPHPTIVEAAKEVQGLIQSRPVFGVSGTYIEKSRKLVDIWKQQSIDNENIVFIEDTTANISDYYSETDLLISDGSSLVWEFIVLERPVLLYESNKFPEILTMRKSDQAFANSKRDVGCNFTTDKEFLYSLKKIFDEHRTKHLHLQKKYIKEVYGKYTDGKNIERLILAIDKLQETKVFFIVPDNCINQKEIKEKYEAHYANIDFHFITESSFMNLDSEVLKKYSLDDAHRVVLTNIDVDCDLFSHCYIGYFARKAGKEGVRGLVAHQLTDKAKAEIDAIHYYAESVVRENGWEKVHYKKPDQKSCFLRQHFFMCFDVEGEDKGSLADFLGKTFFSAEHLKIPTYIKHTHENSERCYVVKEIGANTSRKPIRSAFLKFHEIFKVTTDECVEFMQSFGKQAQVLGKFIEHYPEISSDIFIQVLGSQLLKLPQFTPATLILADLLALTGLEGQALQSLLACLKQNDKNNFIAQKFHQILFMYRIKQLNFPTKDCKKALFPFGYIDNPKEGTAKSKHFEITGWTSWAKGNPGEMFILIDGMPVFGNHWIKRDSVANTFPYLFSSEVRPGFVWLCEPEELTPNKCHTVEVYVVNDANVYCVGERHFFVNNFKSP